MKKNNWINSKKFLEVKESILKNKRIRCKTCKTVQIEALEIGFEEYYKLKCYECRA